MDIKNHIKILGIPIGFFLAMLVPSTTSFINFNQNGEFMWLVVGWVFIGLAVLGVLTCLFLVKLSSDIPSQELALKKSKMALGFWLTGHSHLKLLEKYKDTIKRILVLNPESQGFKDHLKDTDGNEDDVKREIQAITKEANDLNIPIKWYGKYTGKSITVYDSVNSMLPHTKKSFLTYSIPKDKKPSIHRDYNKIQNRKNGVDDFRKYARDFNKVWFSESEYPKMNGKGVWYLD
jgi:hypothetical protein